MNRMVSLAAILSVALALHAEGEPAVLVRLPDAVDRVKCRGSEGETVLVYEPKSKTFQKDYYASGVPGYSVAVGPYVSKESYEVGDVVDLCKLYYESALPPVGKAQCAFYGKTGSALRLPEDPSVPRGPRESKYRVTCAGLPIAELAEVERAPLSFEERADPKTRLARCVEDFSQCRVSTDLPELVSGRRLSIAGQLAQCKAQLELCRTKKKLSDWRRVRRPTSR